jgi:hypothetical protein
MYLLPEEMSDTKFNSWWVTHSPGEKCIDTLHNIIVDKTPHIIQDPVSIYCRDDRYYITVNIRDSVSFLYQISFANLMDFVSKNDR